MKFHFSLFAALATTFQPNLSYACKMARPIPSLSSELVSFKSCQELEAHVTKLTANKYKDYDSYASGFGVMKKEGARTSAIGAAPAAKGAMADTAREMSVDSKPERTTGTNNQVAEVDEADFVKFNGQHIYQIHNGTLKVLKAWPANALNQIASLPITGQPQELLMNESNAVILANEGQKLKATVVDVRQPSQPRVLTEFEIPGQYRTARLVGDTLRIVNQDYNSFEMISRAEPAANTWFQEETISRRLNIKPTTQIANGQNRTLDTIKDCANVWVPKEVAPQVLTRIISIDLKAKKYEETLAYIQPETVYASKGAIYLTQSGYNYGGGASQQQTAIHKFSIEQSQPAHYQASGIINGHLLNQFALDEHKNHLRVATNGTELLGKSIFGVGGQWNQVSRVQVLAQIGKRLKSIGQTPDLAKGERLYSARFDGDKGYVVTFRQVDPLFTIDLSNPYRPRVMGELKVPGFSTYIHMMGRNHLLTIGQDADETTGRARGLKLSVFDVQDFAHPKEVKSLIFKGDVSSESSYEHKAFSFYDEKGVLAIPATQGSRNSLLLFKVTTSDIKASGEVGMSDLQSVRRSFFADNFVYAIGTVGVRAATIENPQLPVGTVFFDRNVAEVGW